MPKYDDSPFAGTDAERHEIWDMLVRRDSDAYLRQDWSAVEPDFITEGFYGIDARGKVDASDWRLSFASLAMYRNEWLRQAAQTARTVDSAQARAALFNATQLSNIDIQGDVAMAYKNFNGGLPHRDGTVTRLHWRTLYVCRRPEARWRIASFVGYLPHDSNPGTHRAHFAAATSQHVGAGPYTPVVGVAADAQLFVISGQAPLDAQGRVVGSTIEQQSRATLANCRQQLEAAGCSLADVFKATVYLTDLANWQAFNVVYRELMQAPFPARTAVQTGLLPGFLVEIEMWAAKR
jgi:enamine deaminase RidA (YjgF/YER057c/UK114 family)